MTLADLAVSSESLDEDALENADYHRHTAVSKSHLDQIARSPLHYWARYLDPNRIEPAPTPAMRLGTAVHTLTLESDSWDTRYVTAPAMDRRTKEGKAMWAEFEALSAGRELISCDDRAIVSRMAEAVWAHPAAGMLLNMAGQAETTHMWIDGSTGLECKCRPDWLTSDGSLIVDLKTTEDASLSGFRKSIGNFRYHVQSAWYLHGLEQATGRRPDQFIFICVEKKPPHAVAVYAADSEMISIGYETAMRDLQRLAECKAAGSWPGYSEDVQIIGLPGWMRPRPDGLPMGEPPEIELY
ncbi:MAG: PD-(D/E)XK nuclease-like domain-containing protein [Prochlorococcaceae cyanobacterium]